MSLGSITTQHLTDIANAIRTKLGVSTRYKPSQMAAAIASIPTGGSANLQTKTATYTPSLSQQTDTITPDAGYDGLDEVDITVNAVTRAQIAASSGMMYGSPTITVDPSTGIVSSDWNNYNNPSVIYPIATAGWAETTDTSLVYGQVTDTYQLPTKAAATYYPSTSDQYIGDDQYLTGQQTIKAVTTTNLTAANIKEGVTVQVGDSADPDRVLSVTGTYSGGGGIGELLTTKSLGTISTSSTTATDTGQTVSVSGINDYDALLVLTKAGKTNNRHVATAQWIWLTASSTQATKNGSAIATATWNARLSSSGVATTRSSTAKYGIYVNAVSISSGTATLTMYQRYNSTQTGTINGSYTTEVYGVKVYDLI